MSVFITNGVKTCEVIHCEPDRDRMGVLCWESEDYGLVSEMRISEATAAGFTAFTKE